MAACSTGVEPWRVGHGPLVLIREDVHDAFKKAGLTGFKVYKAEGWNGLEL